MKKHFCIPAVCFILIFLFSGIVFAEKERDVTNVLASDALLENFEEKEAVEALAPEILDMANSFIGDGFHAELSDIDFSKAYCVYVEANILEKDIQNLEDLRTAVGSGKRVWCIPVVSGENMVLVQVSKAPELEEMEQGEYTVEEWEEAKAYAGNWWAVSSTLYKKEEVPAEGNLKEILSGYGENVKDGKFVLVGGEPGIHSVIAVLVGDGDIKGVLSISRELSYTRNTRAGRNGGEVTLEQNVMYALDDFADASAALALAENASPDSAGGGASGGRELPLVFYIICAGVLCLAAVLLIILNKRNKRLSS